MGKVTWAKWDKLPPGKPVCSCRDTKEFVEELSERYKNRAEDIKSDNTKVVVYMVKDRSLFTFYRVRFYLSECTKDELLELQRKHRRWTIYYV